ncbi:hypothetical protein Taro_010057 [Colocasia esculenta]|uniref:Glycosyltransferase n=1 Tax=Colocasia esculenta TaxID=4460 RepID=A0A843U279_COLES|nr:hypothetical protein [Colocasia esculenta]
MDPAAHHVVALPSPGRGHVNPMLNLCENLLARAGDRLLISFVVTEEWLGLLGPAAAAAAASPRHTGLRFRTLPNVLPSEHNRGADMKDFIEALYTRMEGPFDELLGRLRQEEGEGEPPVRGIIYDTFLSWAVAVGNRRQIPVYSLFTQSASFFSVLHYLHLVPHGEPLHLTVFEEPDESLDFIPGITSLKMGDIQSIYSLDKSLTLVRDIFSWAAKAQCLLFTSFYELESRAVDALKATLPFPIYPVGPSIPYTALHNMSSMPVTESCYYSWLETQPRGSVLYVSLGSFLFVSNEQMDEIARGLCASGVSFLWVARREAARMQEMSGGTGLVVPWCDQLKALCHPAVGGFLTHCGWNSTLEAVYAGVPMLTFPIAWDQPANSRLIVDEWKTGLSLEGEAAGDRRVVGREEIARTVQRLMDSEGEESKELRSRAGELKEACRRAVQVGGSSTVGLDAFIAHMETGN